jgi:hypothetical protein
MNLDRCNIKKKKALLFVNKKKQKNFIRFLTGAFPTPREAEQKSFLVTFFQKSNVFPPL